MSGMMRSPDINAEGVALATPQGLNTKSARPGRCPDSAAGRSDPTCSAARSPLAAVAAFSPCAPSRSCPAPPPSVALAISAFAASA